MIPTAHIAPGSEMVVRADYTCIQGSDFDDCFTPATEAETCLPVSISCLGTSTVATIHATLCRVSVC